MGGVRLPAAPLEVERWAATPSQNLRQPDFVAPILRGADERALRRPVKVYDRETGEVLREATVREVVGGLAKDATSARFSAAPRP